MAIPALSEQDYTNFWMDSGATSHVCNNRNLFTDYSLCSQNLVGVGSDPLSILGTGTMCFFGPNNHYLTLNNVLFVPDCRKCLVSLARSNPSLKLVTSVDRIFDGESGQRNASPIAENLNRFDYRPVAPHAASFSGFSASPTVDEYTRHGHAPAAVMRKLGIHVSADVCTSCMIGCSVKSFGSPSTSLPMLLFNFFMLMSLVLFLLPVEHAGLH
ncbi:hypothetical protein BVG19_g4427 [[Candida] boidinii]|nr:hypothetical protein BVG19_g4427 [[Candida] boidinii]OWB49859.1 hypothetical protein B5S27_g1404 [[Candida] boidinii]OWB82978.1 hypothetical protein B5S33_g1607 [[Candida] boidinii]